LKQINKRILSLLSISHHGTVDRAEASHADGPGFNPWQRINIFKVIFEIESVYCYQA
jgi:hypothetical protein